MKGAIQQEHTVIINIYTAKRKPHNTWRKKFTEPKGETDLIALQLIVGNANTSNSMSRKIRKKISKETEDLNNTIDQWDLTDIENTPMIAEYTFFSSVQEPFSR